MKKFIIMCFVFVMMLSMSAIASETRVMTMGDNNNVLLDEANIWLYPSRILDHSNIGVAEISSGDSDFSKFGINWKMDDISVLGTYFSTDHEWDRINLFYGRDMGTNKFGVHLNFQHWSETYENDTLNIPGTDLNGTNGNSEMGDSHFDLTVGLTEGSGQWDVALNFGFGSFTDVDNVGDMVTEPDGISNMGIYGRYFQIKNPNYTMIHHVAIMTNKYGEADSAGVSWSDKSVMLEIGSGFNFTPSSHVLGVFDFGLMYGKVTSESSNASADFEQKIMSFPYFKMGFDGEVFKWLDIRFGATSYWMNSKQEFESHSFTQKYADNKTYFGLGFNWGHLHVDTEANPEFFLEGPDFLAGGGDDFQGNDMAASLSATYDF